jgi:hypothetical protein
LQPKTSAPKLDLDTGITLRNKALLITPKEEQRPNSKKFQLDKLSKFINLNGLDMNKFKGGEKNFSGLLDDVTFIPDPLSAQDKVSKDLQSKQSESSQKEQESASFEIIDTSSKASPPTPGIQDLKPEK